MASKDIILVLEFDDRGTPKVKKVIKDVGRDLQSLGSDAAKSGKGFDKLKKDVASTEGGLSRFRKALKSTAGQMAMGMGVTMGIHGAMRMMRKAISDTMATGREFERSFANVTTMLTLTDGVIDGTTISLDKFRQGILDMNPALGDATDLAKGMYQVLSASVDPAKAITFLGEAAKAATAGVTDTFTAVDAMTTVLNAYGWQAEEATRVSDIMFTTVKRGKLTYEGMAGALGTVVPIAAQVGVRLEEVAAAMANLTRQGIDVNTTTVQLRQIMVSVLKPTAEAEAMSKKLGVAFDAVTLKRKGLMLFLSDLMGKVGDNAEAMTAFFGNVRALVGVMGLAGSAIDKFKEDLYATENALGATEEAFRKQMASTDFWMKALKNVFNKMKIAIYDGLSAPFKEGIKDSKTMEEKMALLQAKLQDVGRTIGETIGKAIKTIVDLKSTLIVVGKIFVVFWAISKMSKWSVAFSASMTKASADAARFGTAMKAASKAAGMLNKALSVVGVGFFTYEITRAISELTGLDKVIQNWMSSSYKATSVLEGEARQAGELREILRGTGMSVLKLVSQYGSYTKALEAVKSGKVEITRATTGLSGTLNQLAINFVEAYSAGTLKGNQARLEIAKLITEYQKAGKQIPEEINRIADELDAQAVAQKQAATEWQQFVDSFKKGIPTFAEVSKTWKGMQEAMRQMESQGASTDQLTLQLKDSILKLYEEAEAMEKLFGTKMPESLRTTAEALKNVNQETGKASTLIMGMFTPALVESMQEIAKANKLAEEYGLSFENDVRKQLEKTIGTYNLFTSETWKGAKLTKDSQRDLVETIIKLHQKLGLQVPNEWKKIWKELQEGGKKTSENLIDALSNIGPLLQILADDVGGNFGTVISTVGLMMDQVANSLKNGITSLGGILTEIGPQMLGKLGGAIGQLVSGAKESFASLGASLGATIGGIFGPVGKAVGGLFGGLIGGLFKKKQKLTPEQKEQKQMETWVKEATGAMARFGKISEDTAGKIAEARKTLTGFAAESKYFADVIKDVGVNQKNVNDLWYRAQDIIHHTTQGFLSAEEGAKALGDSFTELVAGAKKLGVEGSRAMTDFINQVRASGLEVKEVTDYINEQLGITRQSSMSAAEGLQAMADYAFQGIDKLYQRQSDLNEKLKEVDEGTPEWNKLQEQLTDVNDRIAKVTESTEGGKGALARLERQALAVANAMMANGASMTQVMDAMGGTLDAISQRYEQMGIEASSGLAELLKIREVTQEHQGLFNAIEGNLAVLNALANTGSLNQEVLQDAANSAKGYYNQLVNAGLDSNQALAQMAPTLERLRYLSQEHNLALDKGTQEMIAQAEAAGVLKEQEMSMQDAFLGGIGLLLEALGTDLPEAMQKSVDKLRDMEDAIHGSGVVSAMEKLQEVSNTTFTLLSTGSDDIKTKLEALQSKLGDTGTSTEGLKTKFESAFSAVGTGIDGAIGDLGTLQDEIAKGNWNIPMSWEVPNAKGGGKVPEFQTGGSFRVTDRDQPFIAHRGEDVSIRSAGDVNRTDRLLEALISAMEEKGGGAVVFAPQFNLLDGSDVEKLIESKLFPEFIRLIGSNKGGARTEFRVAMGID